MASRQISVDQFVSLTGVDFKTEIPGREVATMFGFNPDTCIVEVNDRGLLRIRQDGNRNQFASAPNFWREITPSQGARP